MIILKYKMFSKKCPECNSRIKKEFDFCPSCGANIKSSNDSEDYGFLGKNDSVNEVSEPIGFEDRIIDKIFKSATKMMERQLRSISNEIKEPSPNAFPGNLNVKLFVNGKNIFDNNFNKQAKSAPTKEIIEMSSEKIKKLSKLPKKEAQSKLMRMGERIVYEISVPGVQNIEDILINQLESSIEVKALSNDKVYHKIINLNLPILRYKLVNGNLFLELGRR